MSLNKYMHPRNRYKNAKPSFLDLALKYADFRAHITQDETGKVLLDFKNADALRALSTCLLKEDFDLTVDLPPDRLVPTLPLRLNYIHWLEDIVGTEADRWGFDIGTGASCVYPLLAAKMNGWNFLATESDLENVYHAKKNVEINKLTDQIHVLQVTNEDVLMGPLEKFTVTKTFDFCMCNPPFFADHMEAQAIDTSRSFERPEAGTVSTASPQECIVQGGEVGFVRQMIEESTVLRDKIRVYTSMVGKKASLGQLKEELRHQKVAKYSTTEFCQGKTMRWGIAWTFDETVTFPRSHFEARKEKPPLQFFVPFGAAQVSYRVHSIAEYLKTLLRSKKVHCYQGKMAKSYTSITLTAVENTWCHQRRLRRKQQRMKGGEIVGNGDAASVSNHTDGKDLQTDGKDDRKLQEDNCINIDFQPNDPICKAMEDSAEVGKAVSDSGDTTTECDSKKRLHSGEGENASTKKQKLESDNHDNTSPVDGPKTSDTDSSIGKCSEMRDASHKGAAVTAPGTLFSEADGAETQADESPKEYILKCVMRLKRVDEQIRLELDWLDGQSRELLHQIMTFLQNKLKVEPNALKK